MLGATWLILVAPDDVEKGVRYVFQPDAEAPDPGEELDDAKGLAFDSVASVTTNAKDGVKLNLPGKGAVAMADIKQVL